MIMTNETTLHVIGILLGGFLSLIFIGYMVLSFSEGRRSEDPTTFHKLAGLFSLAFGAMMAVAWIYLLAIGQDSFRMQASDLSFHVLTEFTAALMFIVAGVAMFRNWSRGPALYMISNALLLFTTVFALTVYGSRGHPLIMNGIAILLTVGSIYMLGLVYGWEHFVLRANVAKR